MVRGLRRRRRALIVIDSREVRARFELRRFRRAALSACRRRGRARRRQIRARHLWRERTGGAHDGALSCTHDANAWPADRYAGLPAPAPGERVMLWVQNSHPVADPAGRDRAQSDGRGARRAARPSRSRLSPAARSMSPSCCPIFAWPRQIEVRAGKHVVRPRYEVVDGGRRRIAHVNVERADLRPDPELARTRPLLGKGYLLPAPILPRDRVAEPGAADADGAVADRAADRRAASTIPTATRLRDTPSAGCRATMRPRSTSTRSTASMRSATAMAMSSWSMISPAAATGDGWLHALFRYRHRAQRPCRRDQLRRACLQHAADLSRRAAILYRAARRDCRRGCSCASARRLTTRCAI